MRRIAERPLAEYHPQVGVLWRSRHEEPESEEFDSLPGWMITDPMPQEDLADVKRIIAEFIDALTKREAIVIYMRFWGELTFEECAEKLGVTRERVRQIELKAMRKMRHPTLRAKLREYSQWSQWATWFLKNAQSKDRRKIYRSLCMQYPCDELGYSVYL